MVLVVGLLTAVRVAVSAGEETVPEYRTKIPDITPRRWLEPAPPVPERRAITREDYLKYIKARWFPLREHTLKKMDDLNHRKHWESARREAFFYKITGQEEYARNAMGFIRGDYRFRTEGPGKDTAKYHCSVVTFMPSVTAYHWIRTSPSLSTEDHALVRG